MGEKLEYVTDTSDTIKTWDVSASWSVARDVIKVSVPQSCQKWGRYLGKPYMFSRLTVGSAQVCSCARFGGDPAAPSSVHLHIGLPAAAVPATVRSKTPTHLGDDPEINGRSQTVPSAVRGRSGCSDGAQTAAIFEGAAWGGDGVDIESVASVAVITPDAAASRRLYVDALGLPLQQLDGEYFATQEIDGCQHFGVWPLSQAAEACFGTSSWPAHVAVPQMSLEFELADPRAVADGAEELRSRGYQLLHDAKKEPWGQTVARLLSPEGVVVGLSYAPWLHP